MATDIQDVITRCPRCPLLEQRIEELERENSKLREKLGENSHNSSKSPSSDATSKPRHPNRAPTGRKRGAQPGHTGTARPLVDVPDRVHPVDRHRCARCGSHDLKRTDHSPRRHQVTEIPARSAEVDEWQMFENECVKCGHRDWATLPSNVSVRGFGPRLLATIGYMTGALRLSRRTTEQALSDLFGVPMSLGSVSAVEKTVSSALEAPVDEAKRAACAAPVGDIDETGWRQHNHKAWLWVLCTELATVFAVATGRGHSAFQSLIGGFKGILVSDRWVVYDAWDMSKRQLCWSHLQRAWMKFIERGGASAVIGSRLLEETQQMFRWWHKVRDGSMSRENFRHHMGPLMTRVQELLDRGMRLRSHRATSGTCARIRRLAPALWTFVEVEGVEPTNNAAERSLRTGVLWRRVSLGSQSLEGSRYVERILTATATVRQHHGNIYEYLVELMSNDLHGRPAPSLLTDKVGTLSPKQAA